ncbi:MAG: rhomboid family intramembrane serine protease [Candidatus Berkiella sp.]
MLTELSNQISDFVDTSRQYLPLLLKWLAVLWLINIANWYTGSKLNSFGIRPRRPIGLVGILLAPFLHGNFTHLLFNTVPLFCLGLFVMTLGVDYFYWSTVIICLLSGFTVWLIGRRGSHIGASALIAGYFGFVVACAYLQPTFTTFFCAAVALYYFGGILFSLFPTDESTSWEGHLSGFLAGIISMIICTNFKAYLPVIA